MFLAPREDVLSIVVTLLEPSWIYGVFRVVWYLSSIYMKWTEVKTEEFIASRQQQFTENKLINKNFISDGVNQLTSYHLLLISLKNHYWLFLSWFFFIFWWFFWDCVLLSVGWLEVFSRSKKPNPLKQSVIWSAVSHDDSADLQAKQIKIIRITARIHSF